MAFDLLDLDFSFNADAVLDMYLEATLASGGVVSLTVSQNTNLAWADYVAASAFDGITSLTIRNDSATALALDNIAVSVVPIPAAVWLFGSALAGLGWMRRR